MTVDIALGFDVYSSEELQNYASNGLLYAGNVDLTRFVEKLLEGMYSQQELDRALDNCEEDVRSERSDWCSDWCSECEAELN